MDYVTTNQRYWGAIAVVTVQVNVKEETLTKADVTKLADELERAAVQMRDLAGAM